MRDARGLRVLEADLARARVGLLLRARLDRDPAAAPDRPDLRRDRQPRAARHVLVGDPAVHGAEPAVQRVPDDGVLPQPARRAARGGAHRRRRHPPLVPADHGAARPPGARDARDLQLPVGLERVPVRPAAPDLRQRQDAHGRRAAAAGALHHGLPRVDGRPAHHVAPRGRRVPHLPAPSGPRDRRGRREVASALDAHRAEADAGRSTDAALAARGRAAAEAARAADLRVGSALLGRLRDRGRTARADHRVAGLAGPDRADLVRDRGPAGDRGPLIPPDDLRLPERRRLVRRRQGEPRRHRRPRRRRLPAHRLRPHRGGVDRLRRARGHVGRAGARLACRRHSASRCWCCWCS